MTGICVRPTGGTMPVPDSGPSCVLPSGERCRRVADGTDAEGPIYLPDGWELAVAVGFGMTIADARDRAWQSALESYGFPCCLLSSRVSTNGIGQEWMCERLVAVPLARLVANRLSRASEPQRRLL